MRVSPSLFLFAVVTLLPCGGSAVAQSPALPPQAPTIRVAQLAARPRPQDPRAAAIIAAISPARIKQEDNQLVSFRSRLSTSDYHPGGPNDPGSTTESTATRGVVPARRWLVSQFQAISAATGGRLQVRVDTFSVPKGPRIPQTQTMGNVIATLPGTDPNDKRIFLVSGHYDSIPANFKLDALGANDDASGTIVSLESARALARFRFPATIEFFTVEGEEQGLYGSRHEAQVAKADGLDIAGMLDDDIVGGDQTPGHENHNIVRIFSQGVNPNDTPQQLRQVIANSWENDSPSRELARFAAEVAGMYLPGFHALLEYRPDRFQRGGDHAPFLAAGYPAVRFTEYHENANHQHLPLSVTPQGVQIGDRGKWISPAFIANVARINALTLAALASSPLPPTHVYFRAGQAIGTPIQWTPVPGAAAYRVLLRPTASPQWTIRIPAPPVPAPPQPLPPGMAAPSTPSQPYDQITIPQSPDNYIIAMVAVDKQGHESLPTLGTARPRYGFGRGGRGRGGRGRG
ncbi:MAG TPA: M28 family peptidase [Terriglobales bacterium]|nr:M28 family peptidase [Terriglobales bacterium]